MQWYKVACDQLEEALDTDLEKGLSQAQHKERLERDGKNVLKEKKPTPLWKRFLLQFKDFMIGVLLLAALISFLLGERVDAYIILAIVLVNALISVYQENRAEQALDALKKLTHPQAKVLREGKRVTVDVQEIVRGDVVYLEAGDFVPADLRLVSVQDLKVEESSLTGESLSVLKEESCIKEDQVALGDQSNMAFMGTVVTYGRASGVVVHTAMHTEMGDIARMLSELEDEPTPLQEKLNRLGKMLAILALVVCGLIFLVGVLQGNPVLDMFMTSVALAVAAIPEGLPAIVTITLALGMQEMVQKKSIIRSLPAVETLGSTTVICTDKTGTLTMNKMTMQKVYLSGQSLEASQLDPAEEEAGFLLKAGVLCNDTHLAYDKGQARLEGDPTEVAYLDLALEQGLDIEKVRAEYGRLGEIPFDSDRKMMSTLHDWAGKKYVLVKGAPDQVLERCKYQRLEGEDRPLSPAGKIEIEKVNETYSSQALRVLALAYKEVGEAGVKDKDSWEEDLVFVGLTAMMDPPREEAKRAIAECKRAGIQPVMITGDHGITALAIAQALGMVDDKSDYLTGKDLEEMDDDRLQASIQKVAVFARVSPEHKVRIVRAFKAAGQVVAMTGDGVNDAPALKNADIGIAMGITGTEVAKGASDMIIGDDNFATIVTAVRQGRQIFNNILKAVQFLLGCNIGEIVVIFLAILVGLPSPLHPIHILWVNLVTDSFIALALGFEPQEAEIMDRPPRKPDASVLADGLGPRIFYQGAMIGLLTLTAFLWGYQTDALLGSTMAFMTLAFSQLFHAFSIKNPKASLFRTGIANNKKLILAFFVSAGLQLSILSSATLRGLFEIRLLGLADAGVILALSLAPLLIVEVEKFVSRKKRATGQGREKDDHEDRGTDASRGA